MEPYRERHRRLVPRPRPIDTRYVDGDPVARRRGKRSTQRVWLRADGQLPDDPVLHACVVTYAIGHDAARHHRPAPRPRLGRRRRADGQPRPRHVVPPARSAPTSGCCTTSSSPSTFGSRGLAAGRSSPKMATSWYPSCKRASYGERGEGSARRGHGSPLALLLAACSARFLGLDDRLDQTDVVDVCRGHHPAAPASTRRPHPPARPPRRRRHHDRGPPRPHQPRRTSAP